MYVLYKNVWDIIFKDEYERFFYRQNGLYFIVTMDSEKTKMFKQMAEKWVDKGDIYGLVEKAKETINLKHIPLLMPVEIKFRSCLEYVLEKSGYVLCRFFDRGDTYMVLMEHKHLDTVKGFGKDYDTYDILKDLKGHRKVVFCKIESDIYDAIACVTTTGGLVPTGLYSTAFLTKEEIEECSEKLMKELRGVATQSLTIQRVGRK